MIIEYKIQIENGVVTTTQRFEPDGYAAGQVKPDAPQAGTETAVAGHEDTGNPGHALPGGFGIGKHGPGGGPGNGNGAMPAVFIGAPVIIGLPAYGAGTESPVAVKSTGLEIETQQELNWCWAAVGVSVKRFFSPESSLEQCQLAGSLLQSQGAIQNSSDVCNQPSNFDRAEQLQDALSTVNVLKGSPVSGRLLFEEVKNEIDQGRPVCARIQWIGQDRGHFVVIRGYSTSSSGEQWLDIADPFYLDSTVPYDQFAASYQDIGKWSDTYLVKKS